MSLTNPFGRSIPNLKGITLNLIQKEWFVQQIVSGQSTAAKLGKKYSIDRKKLNKLITKYHKGSPMMDKAGKPPLLDIISRNRLMKFSKKKA